MAKPTHKEMQSQIITDSVLNFISYMPNPDDIASGTFESYETYRKMKKDPVSYTHLTLPTKALV